MQNQQLLEDLSPRLDLLWGLLPWTAMGDFHHPNSLTNPRPLPNSCIRPWTPHCGQLPMISGVGGGALRPCTRSVAMTSSMTSQPLLGDGGAGCWPVTRGR